MSNNDGKISFDLRLFAYDNEPITDAETGFRFRRDGVRRRKGVGARFESGRIRVILPASPRGRWDCRITANGFETRNTGVLPSRPGETVDVWLPRKARAGWKADFVSWSQLGSRYTPLKRLLQKSEKLVLRVRSPKKQVRLGRFAEAAYDSAAGKGPVKKKELIEAKAGMLNVFAKMMATEIPGKHGGDWFSMIDEALIIQRDRIVGIAKPGMAQMVRRVIDHGEVFPHYEEASADLHRKNIPKRYKIREIYSIKTRERIGVLQVTIADVADEDGTKLSIVDADIDENGRLLAHFGDFIKHQFNGGTHPYNVYDILYRVLAKPLVGYRLV